MRWLVAVLIYVFALIPLSAHSNEGKMFHAIFQVLEPEYACRWEMWRIDRKYARAEEKAINGNQGEWLLVSNAPESWVINTSTKAGQYFLDPGPSIDIHVSVFGGAVLPKIPTGRLSQLPSKAIEELEFGEEVEYLKKHKIKKSGEEVVNNIATDSYVFSIDNTVFKINMKGDGTPLRIKVENEYIAYTIHYEQYELNLTPKYNLFQPLSGINYQKQNSP